MELKFRFWDMMGAIAFAVLIMACGKANAAGYQNPPVPQQVYTVTQYTIDGSVIMTDRAIEFYLAESGCVRYRHPNDNASITRYPRLICGSPVSVKPEEK